MIWFFDFDMMEELVEQVKKIFVLEMNMGQFYYFVKEGVNGKVEVELISKIGGEVYILMEIVERVVG